MNLFKIFTLGESVKTSLFLLFLCIMIFDYAGYGYYLFYLPFFYLIRYQGLKLIDRNFFIVLLWGAFYGVTLWYHSGVLQYNTVLTPIINMPALYLMGKYLARYNNRSSLIIIIFLLTLSLSGVALLSVFKDIALNGYLVVGLERNIPLIGITTGEGYMAATGISSRLIPLAFFYVLLLCPYDKLRKYIIFTFAILAIVCLLRIQSRTSVVGCCFVLIAVIILTWKSINIKQKFFLLLGFCFIILTIGYVLTNYSDQLGIIDRFQSEDVETGGGRLELKQNVISHMMDYPFGGMRVAYAHDIWFDCARAAGIIPFLLLVYITLNYLKNLFIFFRKKNEALTIKITIGIVSFAMFIVFSAEPVLEGIPMCFALFCLLYGILIYMLKSE